MQGKPYAGNPHVRFDEGDVASTATSRGGSLLYKQSAGKGKENGVQNKQRCLSTLGEKR